MYEYKAKCIRVVDGDTIDCEIHLGFDITIRERVRLANINAPESRTRNLEEKVRGLASKDRVIALMEDNVDFVLRTQYDKSGKYGRVIGIIVLSDGVVLNDLLVSEGHAVVVNYK